MRLPDGASRWASVPPPAPLPMMMTSYRSALMTCPHSRHPGEVAVENAATLREVVELGAGRAPPEPQVQFGGEQHSERCGDQIDPDAVPQPAWDRRGDAARRVE